MKKLHVLTLLFILMITLAGCEKGAITNDATADVFVKSILNTDGTLKGYAVAHSVFSYNQVSGVSVKGPDSKTTQLTDPDGTGNSFYNVLADTDYATTLPSTAIGTYSYTVTFKDGTQTTYTNTLSSTTILPAKITGLAKNVSGDSIYISWNAIANTSAYQLKILNGTTQVYYQSAFADNSSPLKASLRLAFPLSSFLAIGPGTYTFELDGLVFETSANDFLQAVSVSTKDIVVTSL